MTTAREFIKTKEDHTLPITSSSKSELVPDKDHHDLEIYKKQRYENPYKTPPNNLTSK